jgi:signal transduction histidine kinase
MSDLEKLIKQIRDVVSVNIVIGENREIEEIHVLAEETRNAKQIVRDIETLLRVECGLELDHKKVSIVQLNRELSAFQPRRLKCSALQFHLQDAKMEAMVEIASPKRSCQGKSSGISSRTNRLRLVAEATIQALQPFIEPGSSVILEDVNQFTSGGRQFVAVTVTYVRGAAEEALVGSALVRQEEKETVVRATLAALNRRLRVSD